MKYVLVSSSLPATCRRALALRGCEVIPLPPFQGLPAPVASHPDLLVARLPSGALLLSKAYYESASALFDSLGLPLCLEEQCQGERYPQDVLLDALAVGQTLYGKKTATSPRLCAQYRRFVEVRQGYARCSVALLSEKAAITADKGLADALTNDGLDVLRITPGQIALPGYDTGFLGGAGGDLGDGTYVFFGDLSCHPDGERIRAFAKKHQKSAVSLATGALGDYGGLLCLIPNAPR